MIPIASMMGYGFQGTNRDKRQITAIHICQSKLSEALSVPFALLGTTNASIVDGPTTLLTLGTQVVDNTNYNISLVSANLPVDFTLMPVNINDVAYKDDDPSTWIFEAEENLNITTNVSKKITMIVTWVEKGKNQTVELSTYKANLDL